MLLKKRPAGLPEAVPLRHFCSWQACTSIVTRQFRILWYDRGLNEVPPQRKGTGYCFLILGREFQARPRRPTNTLVSAIC